MAQTRYFTKSKFKLALECPTKLYYSGKPEYANSKIEDSFLAALANGGFQVGALARCYYPEGIQIDTPNDEAAATVTEQYLQQDKVTLFEAVFKHENFLVRCDVVVKDGDTLDLFEVKAKSCDFADESGMQAKKGTAINSKWTKYIADVAFQKHVISLARPDLTVHAHLTLTDTTAHAPTDGLNQKFPVVVKDGRRTVDVSPTLLTEDLSPQMLRTINVDQTCDIFFAQTFNERRFADYVTLLATSHTNNVKLKSEPSKVCGDCEFRVAEMEAGLLSGHRECWTEAFNWTDEDFGHPTVLDVWKLLTKDKLIAAGKIKFSHLDETDIGPEPLDGTALTTKQRQWKQIEMVNLGVQEPYFDRQNLKREIESWTFPLHFIDFETSMPVIPFKKGRRPYEGVLFQFSHHTVDENGVVAHAGEFISVEPGTFPNYECVRELARQLSADNGTVFRYATHENSYLCTIREQLLRDETDITDRKELASFIETIATPRKDEADNWTPSRPMVDMLPLVIRYHYDPAMGGSNSLKYVLPATLNSSSFLKEKYSAPIYGSANGITSLNFTNHAWVTLDNDQVADPYSLLPMIFTDESAKDYAAVMDMDKNIRAGGAAMTAYYKLQFENIPTDARTQIKSALLKYCELDTLAMVMIYEAWKAEI